MSGFSGIDIPERTVALAQRRDPAAIATLCRVFATPVYTLACRLLQCHAAADDIAQETFEQMLHSLPDFRGDASLATWVRRIAVSRCLMHQRAAWQRKSTALDDQPEMAALQPSTDSAVGLGQDLERALAQLPATSRSVVWLHDVEGYTHLEIAALTGRSVSFSKSCLSRAHARLRLILGDDETAPAKTAQKPHANMETSGAAGMLLETAS
ncbi:MAG: RNA polymerase sigma factor [Pseudomonadota bacterium]